MPRPEALAREAIDEALRLAGWLIQDAKEANVDAGPGVAVRELPLGRYGYADYLLYVDGKAVGVIEAKKVGTPLTGMELQTEHYSQGLPRTLPAHLRPLPFLYQSTGMETRFTNLLDPEARSRSRADISGPGKAEEAPCAPPQLHHLMDDWFNMNTLLRNGLMGLLVGLVACAANPNVRVRRLPDGRIQVEGPMAGPFKTKEDLAQNACEIITSQGGATGGKDGFEYCALHYYVPSERAYYLSYLSDIKEQLDTKGVKSCSLPLVLDDPFHLDAIIIGGGHTHPHNRRFSPKDLKIRWHPSRAVEKMSGRVFQRELWLFFKEKNGECRIYSFNLATRIIAALRDGQWDPIGQVYDEAGNIQMFEGKDWLP